MSHITISLANSKYAPWGLLTEEEKPRALLWLTENDPDVTLELEEIPLGLLEQIKQSARIGIINIKGLEIKPLYQVNNIQSHIPVSQENNTSSKAMDPKFILDVTTLMKKEVETTKKLEEKINGRYPEVLDLLVLPAGQLKKKLKELAKERTSISFFQECKKLEEKNKNRKTVIAVLVEIIKSKLDVVGLGSIENPHSGQSALSAVYYDLIEEFEEESEEEIEDNPYYL